MPPTIILMSPRGGLGRSLSRWGACSWGGGFVLSLLTNFYNFSRLIRASICCFKSKQSAMSWPWSRWKRQYRSLGHLLGSPFSFPRKVKASLSLICIRTWSIGAVNGVKLVNLPIGGLERLSSFRSPVLAIFCPLSCCVYSCLSLFLGFSPEPAVRLQHSCTWWPYKVHLTCFLGRSFIKKIESYLFAAHLWRLPQVFCHQLHRSRALPC